MTKATSIASILFTFFLFRVSPVEASGFMVSAVGGDLAGATEPNGAAIFWNPAPIGPISGASLMLDLNFAWRTLSFCRTWPKDLDPPIDGKYTSVEVILLNTNLEARF